MVTTSDFPQADRLERVGQVALAISKGHRADAEIETYIGLASHGRQGRYYRLAAEVLGLIQNEHNQAVLTSLGEEFTTLNTASDRMDFLARCIVETPVFHSALLYIHQINPTDSQLKLWFRSYYPGAENTADRRFHTFISYLRDADLIEKNETKNRLKKYTGGVLKQSPTPIQGLVRKKLKQLPLRPPYIGKQGLIHVDIDAQKRERANQIHWRLVDAKSAFLNARALEPYANQHIDLYTETEGEVILYEMKSVDPEGSNLLAQIRKAVSQLYEYRYVYEEPQARLCIVTNHGIAKKDNWLLKYLAQDRTIAYEWTEDFVNFQCRDDTGSLLGNFAP